jgi:Leucine-rich repeat (LRR) protein
LYLHGNKIYNLTEIDKLSNLKELTALAIHGNPIENLPGFRKYIINKIPQLKHLNFSGISKAERETAKFIVKSNKLELQVSSGKKIEAVETNYDDED